MHGSVVAAVFIISAESWPLYEGDYSEEELRSRKQTAELRWIIFYYIMWSEWFIFRSGKPFLS